MWSSSAGLFGDKKICDMVKEDRCVLCNGGEVQDIKHFIIECEEFEQYRCELLGRTRRIVGAEEWVNEYEECDGDTQLSLLYYEYPAGVPHLQCRGGFHACPVGEGG